MIDHVFAFRLLVCLLIAGALSACSEDVPVLTGATMGTTYSVIVPRLKSNDQDRLKADIESALDRVNSAMSTYQADSSITGFNTSVSTHWFDVPADFALVADVANTIAQATNGAFDPTVGPLVKRWGFASDEVDRIPDDDEIEALLQRVGYKNLHIDTGKPALRKSISNLTVDLNAIAKGYAVDLLAASVGSFGYTDYLVEIGGELRASGSNAAGERWRIGIEQPEVLPSGATSKGLYLSEGGVATSGDYRNAFESDGVRYSHIIDPRNGYPVRHSLASVTVVADSTMLADGWATALMVLGPDDGLKLADQLSLAGFFIVRDGDKGFTTRSSREFGRLLRN